MAVVCKPPTPISVDDYIKHMIFLAGSIEMGTAENWQEKLTEKLISIYGLTILNPRRDDWNSDWKQSIAHNKFKEQVDWELDGIKNADTVIFYFDPNTKSPITLMELGMVAGMANPDQNVIVCCPEGFWRKGNVDILCSRMKNVNLIVVKDLETLINTTHEFIEYQLGNKDENNTEI